jgi:hypothetical protein
VLLHLLRKQGFRTPLADKESFLPTAQSFISDSKSDLIIGADYGSEIFRSPWFQSTCWEIFSITCKGLLPNIEAVVKNLNLCSWAKSGFFLIEPLCSFFRYVRDDSH